MAIPRTRDELVDQLEASYDKLAAELDAAGPEVAALAATDEWSVKDLLAVRAWWSERVARWIVAGQRGETPTVPERGYKWTETPRLNAAIVEKAKTQSYKTIRGRLTRAKRKVLDLIADLSDRELLDVGVFEWADKWPIARWISINTTRQYTTARTQVRSAIRKRGTAR